jgi:zinc and cadmium transporter
MLDNLSLVIFWSLVGGAFSLVGGIILLSNKRFAFKVTKLAVPFAGGALLGAVFLDLLKEASHEGESEIALTFCLVGIIAFFVLEKAIHWVHHHHNSEDDKRHKDAKIPLIVIGDTMHNFIDGLAIGAAFLVSPASGIVTSLVIATHEIPQEIGDFGLLLSKGLSRKKTLLINVASALASTLSAALAFILGEGLNINTGAILGLTAGFFIYIALSDVIPAIQKKESDKKQFIGSGTIMLILGAITVGLMAEQIHKILQ